MNFTSSFILERFTVFKNPLYHVTLIHHQESYSIVESSMMKIIKNIQIRVADWGNKTSLTPPLLFKFLYQASNVSGRLYVS